VGVVHDGHLSTPLAVYARSTVNNGNRRWVRLSFALVLALVALPAGAIARARFFPPHFDVVSIAASPAYQDPTLLAQAWALPVAATFGGRVDFQPNGSVCGATSVANVFRSLREGPTTPQGVLEGSGKCPLGFCWMGLSLDELAGVVQEKTRRKVTILRDLTLEEFRAHLGHANDPTRRYIVNFHRGLLFSQGVGHHSPIAGYLTDRDLVLVLDVNRSFGPWLVASERLYRAMDSVDSGTKKKRGLLLVE
jgi:hypothetical protein